MHFLLSLLLFLGSLTDVQYDQIEQLTAEILSVKPPEVSTPCLHVVKAITGDLIVLEDDTLLKVGYWYTDVIKGWKGGQHLKITYHSGYTEDMKIENLETKTIAWAALNKLSPASDYIARKPARSFSTDACTKLILNSGWIFKTIPNSWTVRDTIFIFHPDGEEEDFTLWNITRKERMHDCELVGNEKEGSSESILNLEKALNSRVLGQKEASEAIKTVLFNYWIGINDPKTPIGVFLFLGPTGVGKTELAKALTDGLFKSQNSLVRFDMSHFVDASSSTRLIGSPPGYVNHEEGGQLTEALRLKPYAVVLFDEMEKAHPVVQKMFLPVFDEGYINDSKNRKISCANQIFIMTSNICGPEIAALFNKGYTSDEVLKTIEPAVMQALSPELYNRTIPIVFHPLTPDLMKRLVDLMLKEVTYGIKKARNMEVLIDESVKEYLVKNGFHPTLGARPLKRLIQKKVVASLAYAIVCDSIPEGCVATLTYSNNNFHVTWK